MEDELRGDYLIAICEYSPFFFLYICVFGIRWDANLLEMPLDLQENKVSLLAITTGTT